MRFQAFFLQLKKVKMNEIFSDSIRKRIFGAKKKRLEDFFFSWRSQQAKFDPPTAPAPLCRRPSWLVALSASLGHQLVLWRQRERRGRNERRESALSKKR
jgi:hypothetical protein